MPTPLSFTCRIYSACKQCRFVAFFFTRGRFSPACRQIVSKAKNTLALIDCYFKLEEFDSLEKLITVLPEGSPLLLDIGRKLSTVGMANEAVAAFLRSGDANAAIQSCVKQHQWEGAVALADSHAAPNIEKMIT
eukprot:5865856-Pleurochrysis_carterae.AAC.1